MLRPSRWVMAVSAILIMIAGPVHARPRATVAPIQAGYRIPNSTLSPLASCSVPIPELQTDTTTAMVMATCSVTATAPGTLVILADGTTTDWPDAEARFDVRVNGLIVQTQYVDSYQDPVSFALRAAVTIQPGSHTVTLSMARRAGTGHVSVSGGNLSSIAVPAGRPDIVVCGASTIPPFTTTSSGYSSPASCSIQAPSAGTVLILASANHYFVDAYAEANYRVGEPGVTALAHSDRGLVVKQVNATDDGGDGVDSAVTTMGIMPVVAGQTLEVGLLMRRSYGQGTVGVRQASVIGIFLASAGPIVWCGTFTDEDVSAEFATAACSVNAPTAGTALLINDTGLGLYNAVGPCIVQTETTVLPTPPGAVWPWAVTRKAVSEEPEPFNQMNGSIAASVLAPVERGVQYAHFRSDSTCLGDDTKLNDRAVMAIILPTVRVYLPGLRR